MPDVTLDETARLADFSFLPPGADLGASRLRARVDLYEDRALVHTYDQGDGRALTRLVHPSDLASAFAGWRSVETGLLGQGTLFVTTVGRATYTGVWVPPRVWPAAIVRGGVVAHRLRLPMPGAIAVTGSDRRFAFFAARERPGRGRRGLATELYQFPAFNLHANHTICTGSHPFSGDPWQLAEEFFGSYFAIEITGLGRSRRHPTNLLALWEEIDGAHTFPLDDLVPIGGERGAFRVRELLAWLRCGLPATLPLGTDASDGDEGDSDDEGEVGDGEGFDGGSDDGPGGEANGEGAWTGH